MHRPKLGLPARLALESGGRPLAASRVGIRPSEVLQGWMQMQFVPVRYQGSELTAHLLVESPRKDLGTRRNFPVSPLSRFGRFCSCTGVSRGTLSSTRFDTGRKLDGGARTDKVKPRGPQHCPSAASLTRTCSGKWLVFLASVLPSWRHRPLNI